ncbi:DUF1853 family protein [Psychroflexus salis]|uniref:DUF1853 domain-containing protein n=1 Tax=Psychroflexus salis TaxID=1526574 RepID=A0A917E9X8_9FLAO|nr:DUF1853 family protein [Psychroflexus salis]GGE17779.1 hypothetical protein GCM10010831_18760 [Psychroflexus salis]
MQKSQAFKQQIWEQCIGFLKTPDVLLNKQLLPYPNLEVKINPGENVQVSYETIQELQKQQYLGKRVELFFKEWLEKQQESKCLAFSLQIIKDKLTLGEFDFLWKKGNHYLHTELVYKQYIFIRNLGENELENWVGPNKKDFLHWKLKKLKERQFPLLYQASTEKILKEKLNLKSTDFQQNICFKAQMFIHFKEEQNQFIGINSDAILGRWYYAHEFKNQLFNAYKFMVLPKQDWPVLPQKEIWLPWETFDEILKKVNQSIQQKRSVKLWMKTPAQIFQLFVIW